MRARLEDARGYNRQLLDRLAALHAQQAVARGGVMAGRRCCACTWARSWGCSPIDAQANLSATFDAFNRDYALGIAAAARTTAIGLMVRLRTTRAS